MELWVTYRNAQISAMTTLDQMFSHRIRFTVLCQTQDELDILKGYELMYSRKLEIYTLNQWKEREPVIKGYTQTDDGEINYIKEYSKLTPVVYSTFKPEDHFRGL